MSDENDERQQDPSDVNSNHEKISPLSNRFLVAHSSPVHESTTDVITRIQDDSFQSSSSTSNSKSSSSVTSRSSRRQFLIIQHQSAVNSPLMYSRCTSLGSLASYDIRSSCNDSYASECSSIKPSGIISPSDIPDSPPCEPEIIEEEHEHIKHNNRTLTMNTTSSHNRTTMMGETVIEKTFIFNQHELISNQNNDNDDSEHLDEVIVYSYDTYDMNQNHINNSFYNKEMIFNDDSYRVFNSQIDENDLFIDDNDIQNESSFNVPLHENLSVITEESSFIEDNLNSNDETNSIKILYDLIKKPHWTNKNNLIEQQLLTNTSAIPNTSFSSSPSSLSLDSNNQTDNDDDDEYDPEKGRQLIQRLIEETLARRSLQTDFFHSPSCVLCPSNTPMTIPTRSVSSSSSSSISTSTKSCTCITNRSSNIIQQPQRSQSSPARPSTIVVDESKRQPIKSKEKTVHHTRSSFLRLRQAQQNKRLYQQDKRF
ncbi:unnamed protein product [Rotaria sp. Silwood1]|nr:unnamed protein product [Rotaria sp. Silwood1]CAF3847815.1 unnamed protein product [Rotaria sp. Silwood1]CAF3953785.1 unnamed protein product [Rotaria sp. Silwood1]CAF4567536.1 unnamed protein product [Rotaria sp. Silwood1]CAF4621882.1 unnamed protein product [Rotaria sp. Silwood1]